MDVTQLMSMISLERLEFSIITSRPKKPFIDWLSSVLVTLKLDKYVDAYPEEDIPAFVIPQIDRFPDANLLRGFLDGLKPLLLAGELKRVNAAPLALGPPTADTFDVYFELQVRAYVSRIAPKYWLDLLPLSNV